MPQSRSTFAFIALIAGSLLAGPGAANAALVDLGATGTTVGSFNPAAINAAGAVAGTRMVTATGACVGPAIGHATVWSGGAFTTFGGIGGPGQTDQSSGAYDINDGGVVVGAADAGDDCTERNAFARSAGGAVTNLNHPGGVNSVDYSAALAVNATGDVAGFSVVDYPPADCSINPLSDFAGLPDGSCPQPTYWLGSAANGSRANTDTPNREWMVRAIADTGRMVGYRFYSGTGVGYMWATPGAVPTVLTNLIPREKGISPDGRFVVGNNGTTPRFLDTTTMTYSDLQLPAGATAGEANAVNNAEEIVGRATVLGISRAVRWSSRAATPVVLDSLLPAGSSFSELTNALDVASNGHIVGTGTVNAAEHGFVLDGTVSASGTIQLRSCGTSSCKVEALKDAQVTATAPGEQTKTTTTAANGTYSFALSSGNWTITPKLRDAEFSPASRALQVSTASAPITGQNFETCGPTPEDDEATGSATSRSRRAARNTAGAKQTECGPDFMVDAVEITQAVQADQWFQSTQVAIGKDSVPGGQYAVSSSDPHKKATQLVTGKATTVRVFVYVPAGHAGADAPPLRAEAYAGGQKLGALTQINKPKTLGERGDLGLIRKAPLKTYNFRVPAVWTERAKLTIVATVEPKSGDECKVFAGKSCTRNNKWALANVPFHKTKPVSAVFFRPIFNFRRGSTIELVTKSTNYSKFFMSSFVLEYLPLKPGDLRVRDADTKVDGVNPVFEAQELAGVTETGVMSDCIHSIECNEKLGATMLKRLARVVPAGTPNPIVVYPEDVPLGLEGLADIEDGLGVSEPLAMTMAHELLHQSGLKHASTSLGCQPEAAKEPDVWPNDVGKIVGWGWLTSASTSLPPWDAYDVMSYCKSPYNTWISNYNWNKLVAAWKTSGGTRRSGRNASQRSISTEANAGIHTRARARARGRARAGIRVLAVLPDNGGAPALDVWRVNAAPSAPRPGGDITVIARNGAGKIVAQLVTRSTTNEVPSVDVTLPIAPPASIAFERVGFPVSEARQSSRAPRVTLRTLTRPSRIGPRKATKVAWRMSDANRDRLTATVDLSVDGGRTWRPVGGTADSTLTIGKGTLPSTKNGRLRVVVSDGMRESIAMSGKLTITGAPPKITRLAPTGSRLTTRRRTAVVFNAYAFDAQQMPVAAGKLRWYVGKKLIGRGEKVTTSFKAKGRYVVRLVATGKDGTVAQSKTVVTVR